jgi:predicted transcriptional regulator
MATSILVAKLGSDFITATVAAYQKDTAAIDALIESMKGVSETALNSFLSVGNKRVFLTDFTVRHEAHHDLNNRTWNIVTRKLKNIGCVNAADTLQDMNYSPAFHESEITESLIHEVLNKLDSEDIVQTKIMKAQSQLQELTGEKMEFHTRFKVKGGNTEKGLKAVAALVESTLLAWNEQYKKVPHMPRFDSTEVEDQVKAAIAAVAGNGSYENRAIAVKGFANGNVDFKVPDSICQVLNKLTAA